MMLTSLLLVSGVFTYTLSAQASLPEAPAALPVAAIIEQPTTAEDTLPPTEAPALSSRPAGIPFEESPYPVILEKMPFGAPPSLEPLNPTPVGKDPAQEARDRETVASKFSWTAINITPDGKTAIGFTDLSATPPASYYMTVGESANSWTVVDADYGNETATIEKDGIRISLKFGNKSPLAPPTPTPGAMPGLAPSGMPHLTTGGLRHNLLSGLPPPPSEISGTAHPGGRGRPASTSERNALTSYSERLKERMKQKSEAALKEKEELSKLVDDKVAEAVRKEQEAAAAVQPQPEVLVSPEGQPIEIPVQ